MSSPLLTLGYLKNETDLAERVNLCLPKQSTEFVRLLNATIERLLLHGSWYGTVRLVRLCIYDNCITLPRAVASLEAVRSCDSVPINGLWGDFLPFTHELWGCGSLKFSPMGQVPVFRESCAPGIIRTYLQNAADAGKVILYQGRDLNGKWVRSFDIPTQTWIDGEKIILSAPFMDSLTSFAGITGVQKDVTIDRVLVYKVISTGVMHIATYEYDERTPSYQRFRIAPFSQLSSNSCTTGTVDSCCGPKSVEALVKLAYQPVVRDEDFLILCNVGALRLGMQAMKAEQDANYTMADVLWFGDRKNQRIGAIPLLNQELRTMQGDRVDVRITAQGSARLSRVFAGFR